MSNPCRALLRIISTFALVTACGSGEAPPEPTPTSCAACQPNEHCVTCQYAGPPQVSCEPIETPTGNEFACDWLACSAGEVCVMSQPVGDGCPRAECAAMPDECSDDPTCECIKAAKFAGSLFASNCSVDDAGNISLKGF